MIKNRQKIHEGKTKILYKGPNPNTIIQYFKNDTTAFNGKYHKIINDKGMLNNYISEYIFLAIENINIATHLIKRINAREQLIKKTNIIPLEIVVRNIITGSLAKKFNLKEGIKLNRSIIEYYYKNNSLNDPMVTDEHIIAFEWATASELEDIIAITLRINDFLSGLFYSINIQLVDFKLEFGKYIENNISNIILIDEFSPDNCRLWDIKTGKKLDKDCFRYNLGDLIKTYQEVARRLGILNKNNEIIDNNIYKKKYPILIK